MARPAITWTRVNLPSEWSQPQTVEDGGLFPTTAAEPAREAIGMLDG